jgi:Zn-dependent protease
LQFSKYEIKELGKAWFVISLAFAVFMSGITLGSLELLFSPGFIWPFFLSSVSVGIAFIIHELAHKLLAQHHRCFAEFRANSKMLLFSLLFSFMGFFFIAPGGVIIQGRLSRHELGKIASAGIAANLVLGGFFLVLGLFDLPTLAKQLISFGATINLWLAAFNMLPFGAFDGLKVLAWNRRYYGALALACFVLLVISSAI